MSRETYRIRLVLNDGPTLEGRTKQEWSLGYLFKVIWSDSPLFKMGDRITSQEIRDQEHYHPVKFQPEFDVLTVQQHFAQQADVDHGFHQAAIQLGYMEEEV